MKIAEVFYVVILFIQKVVYVALRCTESGLETSLIKRAYNDYFTLLNVIKNCSEVNQ